MTTFTKSALLSAALLLSLPLFAIADGQHNDKTCYAETASGVEISSPCSSRKTTCNDDYSCSIDGAIGKMRDGLQEAKKDFATDKLSDDGNTPNNSTKASDYNSSRSNKNPSSSRAQDYNSSRSNNGSSVTAPVPDHATSRDDKNSGTRAQDYNSSRSNNGSSLRVADYNSSRSNKSERSGTENEDKDEKLEEVEKEKADE